ncbi:MAG: beta-galactosidase [Myxococcales bacterium]|nr:beta-galactosidase [Myxococcales bacterium]
MALGGSNGTGQRPPDAAPPQLTRSGMRLGGRTRPLLAGSCHYFRHDPENWPRILDALIDLGLNAVDTYIPWAVHETEHGVDFGVTDPRRNLGKFLNLAMERELMVIARPGPHINAELTFFGLPERIVYDAECQARSPRHNPVVQPFPPRMFPAPSYASEKFFAEVESWYESVAKELEPRLWPQGPVVLLQVDNECAYYFRSGAYDQDYHADAVTLYRRFLEERYGNLDRLNDLYRSDHASWEDVAPPPRFTAKTAEECVVHLDWARFQEALLERAIGRMAGLLKDKSLSGVPTLHNLSLGEMGQPLSLAGLDGHVDLVGLDYYHTATQHETVRRRTCYAAGSTSLTYAPELGVGAPPWFTPLTTNDSLTAAMTAAAYGLRGFNLYMAVDRDRWCGGIIDSMGHPRTEAATWKRWIGALRRTNFHELERDVDVAVVVPEEYRRLSRVTHLFGGLLNASNFEAIHDTPVGCCSSEPLGFQEPIQVAWWEAIENLTQALSRAQVPFALVDGEADLTTLLQYRVLCCPSFEFVSTKRWNNLRRAGEEGVSVFFGPHLPNRDLSMRPWTAEDIRGAVRRSLDPDDAQELAHTLATDSGFATPFSVSPSPLETSAHHDGQRLRILFVMNPTEQSLEGTVTLPTPTSFEDVISGQALHGDGNLVLRVLPHSIRALEVTSGGNLEC